MEPDNEFSQRFSVITTYNTNFIKWRPRKGADYPAAMKKLLHNGASGNDHEYWHHRPGLVIIELVFSCDDVTKDSQGT